jgi:hypothetical protein
VATIEIEAVYSKVSIVTCIRVSRVSSGEYVVAGAKGPPGLRLRSFIITQVLIVVVVFFIVVQVWVSVPVLLVPLVVLSPCSLLACYTSIEDFLKFILGPVTLCLALACFLELPQLLEAKLPTNIK